MMSKIMILHRYILECIMHSNEYHCCWGEQTLDFGGSNILSLVTGEVDRHLHLLVESLPGWCTVHKVRSGTFLKINKGRELSTVTNELNKVIQQRRWTHCCGVINLFSTHFLFVLHFLLWQRMYSYSSDGVLNAVLRRILWPIILELWLRKAVVLCQYKHVL